LILGLFLTCTENSFLSEHIYITSGSLFTIDKREKKPTYLGRKSFFHGREFPIHSGPLLKANCLVPLAYSAFIFTYKDNITKPNSAVRHTSDNVG
jgi:hypothetical protein